MECKRGLSICVSVLLTFTFCGCATLGRWTAGEESRRQLLEKQVEKWHEALYWAEPAKAVAFADSKLKLPILKLTKKETRPLQFTEFEIQSVDLSESDPTAEVKTVVKSYSKPSYKIVSRLVNEQWRYHRFGGGWILEKSDLLE